MTKRKNAPGAGRPTKTFTDIDTNQLNDKPFYTIDEAAALLQVNHHTIRTAIKAGRLKAGRAGLRWIIARDDLLAYIYDPQLTRMEPVKPVKGPRTHKSLQASKHPAKARNSAPAR